MSDGTGQAEAGQAEPEYAVVAQGDMGLLREVQSVLKRRGVGSHLMPPPEGCGST